MVISRVIFRVTPFRALITLLITYLLSPLPLQVGLRVRAWGSTGLLQLQAVEDLHSFERVPERGLKDSNEASR